MSGRLTARAWTWTVAVVCMVVAAIGPVALAGSFSEDFVLQKSNRAQRIAITEGEVRNPYGTAVLTIIQDPAGDTGTFNINIRLWDDVGIGVPAQTPGLVDFAIKSIVGDGAGSLAITSASIIAPYGEVDDGSLVYYGGGFSNKDHIGIRYIGLNRDISTHNPIPGDYNAVGLQPVAYAPTSDGADLLRDAAILYGVGTIGRTFGAATQNGVGTWTSDPGAFAGDTPIISGQYSGTGGIAMTTWGVDSFDVLPGGPASVFAGPLTDANTFGRPIKAVVTQWATGSGNDGGAAAPASATRLSVDAGYVVLTNSNMGQAGVTTINSAATLQLGSGVTGQNGAVGGAGIVNDGSLVFNNFQGQSYAGPISGEGTLTKSGPGTLTLSGANLYTGATIIDAGRLLVDGALPAGSMVSVNGGGLGGTGAIGGTVTVNVGGAIAPGDSVGTLSVGSLTVPTNVQMAADSIYEWELSPTAGDLVAIHGNLTLNGNWKLKLVSAGGAPDAGTQYDLFTYTGAYTGLPEFGLDNIDDTGVTWDASGAKIYAGSGRVYITGIVVPEPATLSLLALGGFAVMRKRRKQLSPRPARKSSSR